MGAGRVGEVEYAAGGWYCVGRENSKARHLARGSGLKAREEHEGEQPQRGRQTESKVSLPRLDKSASKCRKDWTRSCSQNPIVRP